MIAAVRPDILQRRTIDVAGVLACGVATRQRSLGLVPTNATGLACYTS